MKNSCLDMLKPPPPSAVLLLTSSVHVAAPFVEVTEARTRASLILDSLAHWVRIAPALNIVICDGSGYDFTQAVAERFPRAAIECINFQNDKAGVARYGKGYGEGEIIEYALSRSAYLRACDNFAKCTGKLWVNNYAAVMKGFSGPMWCQLSVNDLWSFKNIRPSFVDTRFYVVNKNFYIRHFLRAYQHVRDHDRHFLEHCFKDVMVADHLKASRFLFLIPPSLGGVSGSSGEVYGRENLIKRRITNRIKSVMLRLNEGIGRRAVSVGANRSKTGPGK